MVAGSFAFRHLLLVSCIVLLVGTFVNGDDRITQLPGLSATLNFSQYAGYITVDESHGRQLFYWYLLKNDDLLNIILICTL